MPIYIYVASPAESAVHDHIDHGLFKSTSALSQCSFRCVVPLAPRNCIMNAIGLAELSFSVRLGLGFTVTFRTGC